jgi:hypothetical protein
VVVLPISGSTRACCIGRRNRTWCLRASGTCSYSTRDKLWSTGGKPRSQLFAAGMNPSTGDEYLAHAVAMKWLKIEGDMVLPGLVNPTPRVTTRIPNHGW